MEGYDVEVLNEYSNDLCCMICLKLMRNPVQFKCGHGMCYSCYKSMANKPKKKHTHPNEVSCPQCRELIKDQYVTSNTMLHRLILSLQVKCNRNDDCLWIGELSSYDGHIELCPQLTCDDDTLDKVITQRNRKQANRTLEDDILSAISQRMSTMEAKLDFVSTSMFQQEGEVQIKPKNQAKHRDNTSTRGLFGSTGQILKCLVLIPLFCVLIAFSISAYYQFDSSVSRLNKTYYHVNEISKRLNSLNDLISQNTGSIKQLAVFHKKAYFNFEHLTAQFEELQNSMQKNTNTIKQMNSVHVKALEKFQKLPESVEQLQERLAINIENIKSLNQQKVNLKDDIYKLTVTLTDLKFIVDENFKALGLLLDKSDATYSAVIELPQKFSFVQSGTSFSDSTLHKTEGSKYTMVNEDLIRNVELIPKRIEEFHGMTQNTLTNLHQLAVINLRMKLNDLCSEEQEIMNKIGLFYVERNHTLTTLDRKFYAHVEQARYKMNANVTGFEKESLKTVSIKNRKTLQLALNDTVNNLNVVIFPDIENHFIQSIERSKLESYKLRSKLKILHQQINSYVTDISGHEEVLNDPSILQKLEVLQRNLTKTYQYIHPDHFVKVVSKQSEIVRHKFEGMLNNFYSNMKQVISFEEQFQRLLSKLERKNTNAVNNDQSNHNIHVWKIENWKNFGRGSFTKIGKIENIYLDYSIYKDHRMRKSFLELAFCPEGVSDFEIQVSVWNQFHEEQLICLPTLNDAKQLSLIFDVCKYFKTPLSLKEMHSQGFIRDDSMYVKLEIFNVVMKLT